MLEAELQRLRDDTMVIVELLTELEMRLALPLPLEPPFPIMADVTVLQGRLYAMARRPGNLKREVRDRILPQTLAAEIAPQEGKSEAIR